MDVFSVRSLWLPVLAVTLVAAFFGAVLARRGAELEDLTEQKQWLRSRVQALERQNARLRAERDALLSSPRAIERVAREEYGFTAAGEKVEEFGPGQQAQKAPSGPPSSGSIWSRLLSWRNWPVLLPVAVFAGMALLLAVWNAASGGREEAG